MNLFRKYYCSRQALVSPEKRGRKDELDPDEDHASESKAVEKLQATVPQSSLFS